MSETPKEAFLEFCDESDCIAYDIEGEIIFTAGASWQAGRNQVRFNMMERNAEEAGDIVRGQRSEIMALRDLLDYSIPDPLHMDAWQIARTRAKQSRERNEGKPVTPAPKLDKITEFPERDTAAARAAGKDITQGRAGE